jgi:hypothetical protein
MLSDLLKHEVALKRFPVTVSLNGTEASEATNRHLEELDKQIIDTYFADAGRWVGGVSKPTYWADKSTGARLVKVFFAVSRDRRFASGDAGNPFLDYANQQIASNFEALKQNILALYAAQVAGGLIEERDLTPFGGETTRQEFMGLARYVHDMLGSEHVRQMMGIMKTGVMPAPSEYE